LCGSGQEKVLITVRYNIATNLSVSVGTVSNIMKLFETTGCVDPKVQPSREDLQKLDNCHKLYILGLIYDNPALQLNEICNKVDSSDCIYLAQQFVGFLEGIERRSGKLLYKGAQISFYPVDQLIWVDETDCIAKYHTRKFGFLVRGKGIINYCSHVR
jgi:hypothetical protein